MTRVTGLTGRQAPVVMRVTQWIARREAYKLTRRRTARPIEPLEVHSHVPKVLLGYMMLELGSSKARRVDHRLKDLVVLKTATLAQCEYCIDISSSIAQLAGISEAQLLALPHYRDSDCFSDLEKLVLDYAVAISRTPVAVSDQLFAELRQHFDEAQIVELTQVIALENMRARFNAALKIGAAGFTDGMVCAVPATIAA
jgi:AhpD family alkylhydroperoxidase